MIDKNKVLKGSKIDRSSFITEIRSELKKVTWPTRRESLRLTGVVVVISLIVGLYIGIIDIVLAKLLEILTAIKK